MARRVRWFVLAVVVLVGAGAAAAWLTVRPDLESARSQVDADWIALRAPLGKRYETLRAVDQALQAGGAAGRSVTKDLGAVLARWKKLSLLGSRHTDPAIEASTANELEALARRVRANVLASAKLSGSMAIAGALSTFDVTVVTPPLVNKYNRAVRAYEKQRSGSVHRAVADILGYDVRPLLVLGTP